jgi:hypothetical protein
MLLLETMETVGGLWLALSAIAFILGAVFVKARQEASESALESVARPELMVDGGQAPVPPVRNLDTAKKRRAAKLSADLVKAA